MKFDPAIHHRRSVWLPGYDYTQPGAYFVTIVTHDRENILGSIADGVLHLNAFGQIANREWFRLTSRFSHLNLDTFITMPNHVHGIICIDGEPCRGTAGSFEDKDMNSSRRARTVHEQFGKPVIGSLPTIIRSYKFAVALRINHLAPPPARQSGSAITLST